MTMVHDAMLERRAPSSVEDAFGYAERELRANYPERVPSMSDGVRGELVLGDVPPVRTYGDVEAIARSDDDRPPHRAYTTTKTRSATPRYTERDGGHEDESQAAPSGRENRRARGRFGVCGTYRARC
jgi:hypothetical protein